MAVDTDVQDALKLLGPRLKAYREDARLSVPEVAKVVGVGRQYIYLIESGAANFTMDTFVKYLRACGVPFSEFMRGMQSGDIPAEHHRDHEMLSTILNAHIPELTQGIHISLDAIADKARRLKKSRDPTNPPGRGKDSTEGTRPGRSVKPKPKTA